MAPGNNVKASAHYQTVGKIFIGPDAWMGTSDNRRVPERILNEDQNGELSKRLLQNGKLYPANVGDLS